MDVTELLAEEVCPCLFHNCDVRDKCDESTSGHEATQDKVVALYFTSHWCEPCHTFTKVLSQAHRAMEKRSSELVIVNIPVESDPDQAKYCYEGMPDSWYTIPPDNQHVKTFINKFGIRTVPRLVVCKPDGIPITYKGRAEIESKLAAAAYTWIEAAKDKPPPKQNKRRSVSLDVNKAEQNEQQ